MAEDSSLDSPRIPFELGPGPEQSPQRLVTDACGRLGAAPSRVNTERRQVGCGFLSTYTSLAY